MLKIFTDGLEQPLLRGLLYVLTFKIERMSVLDRKRKVETGIWVERKFFKYGLARSKYTSRMVEKF